MVLALAVKPEESAVAVLARETDIRFTGLRLRDGSLVLKAKRGRRGGFEQSGKASQCLGVELGHLPSKAPAAASTVAPIAASNSVTTASRHPSQHTTSIDRRAPSAPVRNNAPAEPIRDFTSSTRIDFFSARLFNSVSLRSSWTFFSSSTCLICVWTGSAIGKSAWASAASPSFGHNPSATRTCRMRPLAEVRVNSPLSFKRVIVAVATRARCANSLSDIWSRASRKSFIRLTNQKNPDK